LTELRKVFRGARGISSTVSNGGSNRAQIDNTALVRDIFNDVQTLLA
jgi:hypothetical protein